MLVKGMTAKHYMLVTPMIVSEHGHVAYVMAKHCMPVSRVTASKTYMMGGV